MVYGSICTLGKMQHVSFTVFLVAEVFSASPCICVCVNCSAPSWDCWNVWGTFCTPSWLRGCGQCATSRGRVVLVDVSLCIGVSSHTMLISDVQNNGVMCGMPRRSPRQFGAWLRGWSIPWLVRGCFVHPWAIWGLVPVVAAHRITSLWSAQRGRVRGCNR